VTTLQGSATAARTALPQPVALKFKDDVFQNDRIVTGDQSIVRLLLGGKAVVTVRERSSLTITEVPGKSTIDLDVGKIAVAVAKERMRPGESIEVKTPNAVAAVRGTVFIIEVIRASASADVAQNGVTTNAYGFAGSFLMNFLSGEIFNVLADMFAGATGSNPANFRNMTKEDRRSAPAGLTPQAQGVGDGQAGAKDQAVGTTVASFNAPGGDVLPAEVYEPTLRESTPAVRADILPGGEARQGGGGNGGSGGGGGTAPGLVVTPDSIPIGQRPNVSPAFGTLVAGGLVTDQYRSKGLIFGPARVGIFSDPPNAWGGVNSSNNVDLVSPVEWSLVIPGTTSPAKTSSISVEVGFSAVGSILLEAFGAGGVLLGSTVNDDGTGPHGRTLANLSLSGMRSFRVSGEDSWGIDQIEYGDLVDPPSVLALDGPLLRVVNEERQAFSTFFDITDTTILGEITDPLIWLSGSTTLTTVHRFALLNNSDVTTGGSFLRLEDGSRIIQTGSGEALVSMAGGSLDIGTGASGGNLFDLSGRSGNTQVDSDTGLTLGTDRPLQPGAESPVFEASNATVTVRGSAYRVDTALLEATAPLLNLKNGSTLTTSGNAVDLVGRAKVAIPNDAVAMVSLNSSRMTVTNGHLVNVAGGSYLNLAGNLVNLSNGSTLNILNGLLLNVTGGSVANIGKSLVSFNGIGNVLNVTNNLVPTALIGGIPVYGPADSFKISGNALAGLGAAGAIKINGVALTPTTPLANIKGSLVAIQGNGAVKVGP
jgi:hypothetical protein